MGGWEVGRRKPGPCVCSLQCLFWKRCGKLHAELENDRPSYDSPKKSLSASSTLAFFQRSCLHIIYKVITCGQKFSLAYLEMSGRAVLTISLGLPSGAAYVLIQSGFIVLRAKKGPRLTCCEPLTGALCRFSSSCGCYLRLTWPVLSNEEISVLWTLETIVNPAPCVDLLYVLSHN